MRPRDLAMILVSFCAMIAGAFSPWLAGPLAPLPRLCLMVLLYLGFLSVGTEALFIHARLIPRPLAALVAMRLAVLPLLAFAVFEAGLPGFALGALLIGASSVGVVAPVFSIMVGADTALVLAAALITSLLLPLSVPALLCAVGTVMAHLRPGTLQLPADLSLSGMTLSLCVTILIPFGAAFLTRRLPALTASILKRQFPAALVTNGVSILAIFSQYSEVLRQSPALVFQALGAACLLGLVMMAAGVLLPSAMPGDRRLAFLISYGTMNNVLMLIVSMEFFSVTEALMAAMYLVPLNALLLWYRRRAQAWGVHEA